MDSIETNAKIIAEILGWNEEEIQRQIASYKNKLIRHEHTR
ncbi:hypothetical protein QUF90_14900 [Desulfococcaceae bacterium HSG9]|nr:hypothetical protein [Desulfococcaceae bacterium HSG9]